MTTAWSEFRVECEGAYKAFLAGRPEQIQHHNLIRDGDIELDFVFGLLGLGAPGPGSDALDVGCGGGYVSHCLRRRGYQVTSVDISEAAIAIARQQFPDASYLVADAAHPGAWCADARFDLVYIREFHPFTRLDDFEMQVGILNDYVALLRGGGWVVLGHARRGPCLDYRKLRKFCGERRLRTVGPRFMFLNKHLGVGSRQHRLTTVLSTLSAAVGRVSRRSWIEFLGIGPGR